MVEEGMAADAAAQIKDLKARYFRLLDTKQWDEWKLLFTDDLRFEAPQDRPDQMDHDRESFVNGVRAVIGNAKTVHHGHMPEIELISSTEARGIWAMEDFIWWPDARRGSGEPRFLHGFGHYHETYRRTANGWRIASMKLERLHLEHA